MREDGRAVWRDHREFSVSAGEASRAWMLSSKDVAGLDSRKFGDENGGGRVTVLYRLDDVERLSHALHGGADGLAAKLSARQSKLDGDVAANSVLRESGNRQGRGEGKAQFPCKEAAGAKKRGPYAVEDEEGAEGDDDDAGAGAKKVKKAPEGVKECLHVAGEAGTVEAEEADAGSAKMRAIRVRLLKQVEGVLEWDPKSGEGNAWRVEVRGMDQDTFVELLGLDASRELAPRDLVRKGVACREVMGPGGLRLRKTFTARGPDQVAHVLGVAETVDLEYTRSSQSLAVSGATRVIAPPE